MYVVAVGLLGGRFCWVVGVVWRLRRLVFLDRLDRWIDASWDRGKQKKEIG